MRNYDNHLFRVSSLGLITAGLTTYDQLYDDAIVKQLALSSKVDKYREEYNGMNKATKTAEKKLNTLNNASEKLEVATIMKNAYKQNLGKVAISEGCKTHLCDLRVAHEFGRTKDIKSKYIEKGLQNEETGITLYGNIKGRFLEKNTERKDDGFITGEIDTRDINLSKKEFIIDIKNSWDLYTFSRNVKYIENPRSNPYYESMQGYMKLWDKENSRVCYTLIDTPQKLIDAEKQRLIYDFIGSEELYEEACEELEFSLKFADIDPKRRVIEINIARDEEFISIIEPTVVACREYLNNFKEIYYEVD